MQIFLIVKMKQSHPSSEVPSFVFCPFTTIHRLLPVFVLVFAHAQLIKRQLLVFVFDLWSAFFRRKIFNSAKNLTTWETSKTLPKWVYFRWFRTFVEYKFCYLHVNASIILLPSLCDYTLAIHSVKFKERSTIRWIFANSQYLIQKCLCQGLNFSGLFLFITFLWVMVKAITSLVMLPMAWTFGFVAEWEQWLNLRMYLPVW